VPRRHARTTTAVTAPKLNTRGTGDTLIQPRSGHATRQSRQIYSRLALADARQRDHNAIGNFPL
jgi:integrase/recombinase XerD